MNTFDTIGDDAISVTNSSGNITISDVNSTGVTGDMLQQTNHTGTTTVTNGLTLVDLAMGGTAIANFINQTVYGERKRCLDLQPDHQWW